MKKNFVFVIVVSLLLLPGCAKFNQANRPLVKDQPPKMMKFQRCLTDASTLVKLDKKYESTARDLYALVYNAKFYASVASDSSANVNATITPFFDYRLNEKCNEISSLLIEEFQRNPFRILSGS